MARSENDRRIVVAPVVTMDPLRPAADALATHGELITAVGTLAEVRAACPAQTPVEHLDGSVIVPGLIDAHLHLQRAGLKAVSVPPPAAAGWDAASYLAAMDRTAAQDEWPPGEPPSMADRLEGLLRVQPLLHALGLTAVIDPAVTADEMRAYQRARALGLLSLRVVAMPHPAVGFDDPADAVNRLAGIGVSTGFGDDLLRVGGIKVYFDGEGMRAQALLDRPWTPGTGDHGVQRISDDAFRRLAVFCAAHDWSIGVHAVGGAAVSRVLAILAGIPGIDRLRCQLIHAYLEPSARSIAEAARLGVIASLQPSIHWANAAGLIDRLGGRAVPANPVRSWLDAGATVALGSDGPYFPFDPRHLIWQARTRMVRGRPAPVAPEQAVTGAEALAGYTTGAAYASFAETRRGMLRPGLLADWVALSADPTTCTPDEIRKAVVHRTVVGGRVVHQIRTGGTL